MDGLEHVEPERWLAAERPQTINVPTGCRGAACPFFAACQGRCATKRGRRRSTKIGSTAVATEA
jgi:hypothetical protein